MHVTEGAWDPCHVRALTVDDCSLQRIHGRQPVPEKGPVVSYVTARQDLTSLGANIDAWGIEYVGGHRGAQDVLKRGENLPDRRRPGRLQPLPEASAARQLLAVGCQPVLDALSRKRHARMRAPVPSSPNELPLPESTALKCTHAGKRPCARPEACATSEWFEGTLHVLASSP